MCLNQTNLLNYSFKNPIKSKCSDSSFSGLLNIEEKEIALLMVADGVSKAPKDYLASASVIRFMKEFLENSKSKNPNTTL